MRNIFPIYKFKRSDIEYQKITDKNKFVLADYMYSNGLTRLIITPDDDGENGWNNGYLPDLSSFEFIDELLVYWTNIDNIKGIEVCENLKTLWLDNGDKTHIEFSKFPKLEKFISWDRKGIENVWDVSTLKSLTVAGLKRQHFRNGRALEKLEKLRILKTPVEDMSFLSSGVNITYLELSAMSKVTNLSVLSRLTNLSYINIEANKVKDFSFVHDLENLETCYLSSKLGYLSLDYFLNLNKLTKFHFTGNKSMQEINSKLNIFHNNQ